MRPPLPEVQYEIREVVAWLRSDGTTIVSRQRIDALVLEFPFWCPNTVTMGDVIRQKTITYCLNKWFPLLNQTGKKPRAHNWVLSSTGRIECPA